MDRVHIKATMDVADERAIQHCMQMLSDCISLACGELDDLTAAEQRDAGMTADICAPVSRDLRAQIDLLDPPATRIEILTPDFRGRMDRALDILKAAPPDVMNHNLETVPRLYREARPGSDDAFSLNLLKKFKALHPSVPTKSGLMVGLGETDDEILATMRDMRAHAIDMLTIGQYLAPSGHHLPVRRYVHPDTFRMFEREAAALGFTHAAVGALVRSSYHADRQAHAAGVLSD